MKLVIGLGNPGRAYARTRHNVGFMVIDRLCARRGAECDKRQFGAVLAIVGASDDKVGLVKPETYMNLSGQAVRSLQGYYKVAVDDLLIICDDLALPPGRLRLRGGGSSGGQKGLESTIAALGTQQVARLRVGIGAAPPPMDAADYVLGKLTEDEQPIYAAAVERAADCVEAWLAHGLDEAMRRFNVDPEAEIARKERAARAREAKARAEAGAEGQASASATAEPGSEPAGRAPAAPRAAPPDAGA